MIQTKPSRAGKSGASRSTVAPETTVLHLVPRASGVLAPPAPAGLQGGTAAGDHDLLLSAIQARLRLTVGDPVATIAEATWRQTAARVQAGVRECAAALDRLQRAPAEEAGRGAPSKPEAFDAGAVPPMQARSMPGASATESWQGRQTVLQDPLTRLPNGLCFRERLRRALAQARQERQEFAVLTLELEGHAAIQSSLGANVGDELLRIVAARLVRAVRGEDLVSRLRGDDTFALFIANVASREQLRRLTCKLFDVLSAPMAVNQLEVAVRPSIGIAMNPADGALGSTLLKHAEAAMGLARRRQTGYAFFGDRGRSSWEPGRI